MGRRFGRNQKRRLRERVALIEQENAHLARAEKDAAARFVRESRRADGAEAALRRVRVDLEHLLPEAHVLRDAPPQDWSGERPWNDAIEVDITERNRGLRAFMAGDDLSSLAIEKRIRGTLHRVRVERQRDELARALRLVVRWEQHGYAAAVSDRELADTYLSKDAWRAPSVVERLAEDLARRFALELQKAITGARPSRVGG